MRPWLVVIGVVFLALAGGTLATLYFGSSGNPTTVVTPYSQLSLGANTTERLSLYGSNGSSEQFSLVWQASTPIAVILEQVLPCPGHCDHVLVAWSSNLSGTWAGSGPFAYPLQCVLENAQSHPTTVTLTGRAVTSNPTHFSLEIEFVLGAGAAGLLLVGGLAVFLGVFLKGDPYGPRSPEVSPSPEDAEEVAGEGPPDH